jgi:hypothetical protein
MRLRHGIPSAEDRWRRKHRECGIRKTVSTRTIGHRLFTDGANRPVYEDARGQFIVEDSERIDGVLPVPENDRADMPMIVRATCREPHGA